MANPQYPMQQPPQMQQPMGQQPAHAAPPPARRGTSKIVPVVVSAGLAVGTFCGLLFGVGTGEPADASPSTGNNVKAAGPADTTPTTPAKPAAAASTAPAKPATTTPAAGPAAPAAAATTPATGSAAPATAATTPAAGSAAPATAATTPAAGSAAPATTSTTTPPAAGAKPTVAETAVRKPKLTVELTPASVAATAKITVDGKPLEGSSIEIDLGKDTKKEVKIVVKASGYKTVEQKVDIDSDVAVKIELIKRPSSGPSTGPRPTGTPTGTKKKPPSGGGLIDI